MCRRFESCRGHHAGQAPCLRQEWRSIAVERDKSVARRHVSAVGDVVEGKVNQFGPVSFVGDATLAAPVVVELSFCSQL